MEGLMQKSRQRKVRSTGIVAAITFALLGILSGCDGRLPTEVTPSPVEPTIEVISAQSAQSDGDRCILINGQIYCN
jgi:hypothetical protein